VIDDLLRQHDGVITLDQARSAGLGMDAVKYRIRTGRWRRYAKGVYFADDRPFTDAARIRAAVWGYGTAAVASGMTAAWWHGLATNVPEIVELTMPRSTNGRAHPGTRLRRRDLGPIDVVERRGLRVTSVALTAVESSAAVLDRALQRHAELPALQRAHLRNTGRYGSPKARILLQGASSGARSAAERLLIQLVKSAAIVGWIPNCQVGPFVVDLAFPDRQLAIEVDGYAFHSGVTDFINDRNRQNYLVLHGWQVLRFTWWDLTEHPERVVAEIRRAISAC
jgi:very-short-patch-repair endonuclease